MFLLNFAVKVLTLVIDSWPVIRGLFLFWNVSCCYPVQLEKFPKLARLNRVFKEGVR